MKARWIFGYGSLVWRPAFEHVDRQPARLQGFARRFWQGSTDHRGVPGAPGRVVTLIRDPEASTLGVAYRVSDAMWPTVLAGLDHREKGGYERYEVELLLVEDALRVEGLVYVATPDNPNYLGPAAPETIASQINDAHGPSGPNDEYLFGLERWLSDHGEHDGHVFEVAEHLRRRRGRG